MEEKINESIALIKRAEKLALALSPDDGIFVSFSGGKDSVVMLDLVRRAGVKYTAYYMVTTIDPPESVRFIREYFSDVKWIHPKETFLRMISRKGLPTMGIRYCCERLKEGQGAGHVVMTGVRASESRKRSSYKEVSVHSHRKEHADHHEVTIEGMIEAEHQCIKGKDKVMVYPILKWEADEVWRYIRDRGLPLNPCYAEHKRVGCMFCPFASKEDIEKFERQYPEWKQAILKSLGIYWSRRDKHKWSSPEEYYEMWKKHK